jgi:hypothetical protein
MLSETDIHYITGFLYIVSRQQEINVVLGDKVYDEAAESERDVDIVIASAGETEMIGVEVKDKGRPLDVSIVEGICSKFNDMPTIASRAIVSSSGYTKPARRKAAKYGVQCLTIIRGAVPPFQSVNLAQLRECTFIEKIWFDGPHVHLMPQAKLPQAIRDQLNFETPITFPPDTPKADVTNLRELTNNLGTILLNGWDGPFDTGDIPVTFDVQVDDNPQLHIGDKIIEITHARVTGTIRCSPKSVPIEDSCYLENDFGEPFAAALLIEFKSALWGISASAHTQELRMFSIPPILRNTRPIRRTISTNQTL